MLRGYVYSLFLAEVLDQTLDELIGEVGMTKENSLLARFIRDESTDSSAFLRSFSLYDEAGIANFGEDLYPILLRGNALCHSMRQPSQARCEGLVDGIEGISAKTLGKCENRDHYTFETLPDTVRRALLPTLHDSLNPHNNSFSIGDSVEADWEMRGKYYKGEVIASTSGKVTVKYFDDESVETLDVRFVRLSQQITLDSTLITGGESLVPHIKAPWMVASDNDWRHSCNVTVAHDFADSFVVRYSDGWMGDIYPNERLKKAYDNEMERRGLVIMCERAQKLYLAGLHHHHTRQLESIGFDQIGGPKVTIIVDDQMVTGIRTLQKDGKIRQGWGDCVVLVHGDTNSTNFGTGTKNGRHGQYEILFRVNEVGKMLDFTSVIVM